MEVDLRVDQIDVEVLAMTGSRLCDVQKLPRSADVLALRDLLASALPRGLKKRDVLIYGGVPLTDRSSKPSKTQIVSLALSRRSSPRKSPRATGSIIMVHACRSRRKRWWRLQGC